MIDDALRTALADRYRVRRAVEHDVPALLTLMRRLAEFEGYDADFAVTEETLLAQGFAR